MKINFHDLQSQYTAYQLEINAAIQAILTSSQFIMGEAVLDFEKALANYLNVSHVVSCANGTDALLLALMAIDVKPGDEVITTPFTFIASAEVIALLGATPVFADIDAETYNIDPAKIAAKMTAKTRAIIPVSLFGQPADLDEINHLAGLYGEQFDKKIYVIEDAAQSLGAEYKGKKSATLTDMGAVSFFPTKPLGCYGDGGAVILNDDLLAEKIRSLRVHGQTKRYQHKHIGINARLDTLQAAILQVKLKHFADELQKRSQIAAAYDMLLENCDAVLPYVKPDRTSVFAQYSIRVKKRDYIINYLKSKNIPVAVHYPIPLHLQECFAYLNYKSGDFPVAESISQEIMSLPMSAFVTEVQQAYITNTLTNVLTKELFEREQVI